jgi:hypothetical protein
MVLVDSTKDLSTQQNSNSLLDIMTAKSNLMDHASYSYHGEARVLELCELVPPAQKIYQ